MSVQDSDGIDEAMQGVTHVAMTAAARMGETMARLREQQARDAQARSEQAARELGERSRAEREAARAYLARVQQPDWWDSASAHEVTKAYETARAWRDVDPEADRAERRIIDEVRTRYGVDVERTQEPADVATAVERGQRAGAEAAEQRSAARSDRAEAVALMGTANAVDRTAESHEERLQREADQERARQEQPSGLDPLDELDRGRDVEQSPVSAEAVDERSRAGELRGDAGHAYDSAERREAMANGLDHVENRAAVEARVRSDVAQGRPATEAVRKSPGRAPKARRAQSGAQAARTVQRPGRGR